MKKSTIISAGGLGNQMFQYAFFLAKKKRSPKMSISFFVPSREIKHNGYELGNLFGLFSEDKDLLATFIRKLLIFEKRSFYRPLCSLLLSILKLLGITIVREEGYSIYREEYLKVQSKRAFYFGYWQSPCYFEAIENEVRSAFSFDYSRLSDKSRGLLETIRSQESVSVHIRRGDFLSVDNQSLYVNLNDTLYYVKSVDWMKEHLNSPHFYIFSDDPQWVKKHLQIDNATYIDWNRGETSWEDMCLMSECKHNIIANSTFSWWAAWLNRYEKKQVLVPKCFLRNRETPNIYPADWLQIDFS
ncbi:alpha-1,2-fucosyltransferase [Bacteroidales bacterium OttesenSCG-928-M11]|nr:alpha-1,2-fucosyltransferase [Bacteroidales bacterium OttesenSCG-928-M11]